MFCETKERQRHRRGEVEKKGERKTQISNNLGWTTPVLREKAARFQKKVAVFLKKTATFLEKAVDFLRNRRARLGGKAQRMPTFVDFAGVPYGIGRFDRERLRAQQAVGAVVDQDFARTHRAFERIIAQNGHPQLSGCGGKGLLRQKSLVATAQLGLIGRQLAGVGKKQGHVDQGVVEVGRTATKRKSESVRICGVDCQPTFCMNLISTSRTADLLPNDRRNS